ncbi:MAG: acyltransferase [Roseiflexaceae bacterium]
MLSKPSFGDISAGQANNFDALRFFLATLVVFSHSFALTNVAGFEPLNWLTSETTYLGEQAVNAFFIISGYLITASWMRSPHLLSYFQKRVLRIYPGFIVVSLICLLIVGPIGAANIGHYFQELSLPGSAINIVLLNKLENPAVFSYLPFPDQLNGSLWTIKIEFECYILVALLGLAGILRRRRAIVGLFILCLLLNAALTVPSLAAMLPLLQKLARAQSHFQFGAHFLAGTLFYLYRDSIPVSRRFLAVAAVGLLAAALAQILSVLTPFFTTYILFYLAFSSRLKLHNFAKHGDLSYGIYLYGWPVQLLVAHVLGANMHPYIYFCICIPLIYLAANCSWHGVEKPFLRLKKPRALAVPESGASASTVR